MKKRDSYTASADVHKWHNQMVNVIIFGRRVYGYRNKCSVWLYENYGFIPHAFRQRFIHHFLLFLSLACYILLLIISCFQDDRRRRRRFLDDEDSEA